MVLPLLVFWVIIRMPKTIKAEATVIDYQLEFDDKTLQTERDTIKEGDILGLKRTQALGKWLEIYKNDNSQSKKQKKGYLRNPPLLMRLMTNLYAIL